MNPDRYNISEQEGEYRIAYRKETGDKDFPWEYSMGTTTYKSFEEAREGIRALLKMMDWNMIHEPYAIVKVAGFIKHRG